MKTKHFLAAVSCAASFIFTAAPSVVHAQAPGIINYQGLITGNDGHFNGTGQFRFLIYRDGPPVSLWSHDGSSAAGGMPDTAISLPVDHGLFSIGMGDTSVPGMTATIPVGIFSSSGLRLRIWFSDGNEADAVIADHPITSVGYALFAASVADGCISTGKIANGAVTSAQLADDITLANAHFSDGGVETVTLDAATGAGQGALLTLRNGLGSSTFVLDADTAGRGGSIALRSGNDRTTVAIDAHENGAGAISLRDTFGIETVDLAAATAIGSGARFDLRNGAARTTVTMAADGSGHAGSVSVYNNEEKLAVHIDGDEGNSIGGVVEVYDKMGEKRAQLDGQGASGGGELVLHDADGTVTVNVRGAQSASTGSVLEMYKADGTRTVFIDADSSGEGKVSTQVLEITGGSDFSENFDIQSADAQPGMLVSIDPEHPGELTMSDHAYDRTVAGVVSGAGGVKPGLMMGQRGTRADGKHPVALTGRVYCLVDADRGSITPGDLITTSATPGHGMKVGDHSLGQGAIVGKAMTGLASGKGLVLVLVSLQ